MKSRTGLVFREYGFAAPIPSFFHDRSKMLKMPLFEAVKQGNVGKLLCKIQGKQSTGEGSHVKAHVKKHTCRNPQNKKKGISFG